jgi:hypothetical protein
MKKLILFYVLMLLVNRAPAEGRTVKQNNLVWFGDFTKLRLNEKFSFYFDTGLRRTGWFKQQSQLLLRPGLICKINQNADLTAGFAYFEHTSGEITRKEFRGWEQLMFTGNFRRLKITQRLRIEQRSNQFVSNGTRTDTYKYTNRYRYQLGIQLPLNHASIQNKTVYLTVSDEIMINSGREIKYNYFDQNRASAGFGYKLNELFNISISYMNNCIVKNKLRTFENNNVIVLNIYHNFNMKRK